MLPKIRASRTGVFGKYEQELHVFVVFDAGFEKMLVHVYTNSVRKSESLKWAVYGGYEVIQIPFSTN